MVDETIPLARLVRPGLPGVEARIDDASPHVCVPTAVKQCFTRTTIAQTAVLVTFAHLRAIYPSQHPSI